MDRESTKYLLPGIIGSLVLLFGFTQSHPQIFYVLGSTALLVTAIHYKLLYFIALELILIAGHTAILIGAGPYIQLSLPILLSIQLLLFYLMIGKENSIFLFIGICGIALLSIGFAHKNQWIFFSGSAFVAIYAYYSAFTGHYASYIWAILNTLFTGLVLTRIYFL